MVIHALETAWGGEIFVPKIPSYRITDVAAAIGPKCDTPVVGIRPGEKLHEEMITVSDSLNTVDIGSYYAILPSSGMEVVDKYIAKMGGKRVEQDFSYNSGSNEHFLTVSDLRELIAGHVKVG